MNRETDITPMCNVFAMGFLHGFNMGSRVAALSAINEESGVSDTAIYLAPLLASRLTHACIPDHLDTTTMVLMLKDYFSNNPNGQSASDRALTVAIPAALPEIFPCIETQQ